LDDLPSPPDSLTYGPMNYDVLIHPDVMEELELKSGPYPPQLRKNVSVALQCLAVRGYTNIVKGISNGTNRGWRRSPLGGGSNGMHYYLWWALSSTAAMPSQWREESNDRPFIVVREIRHHDKHDPISLGHWSDYHQINQEDIDGGDKGSFEAPWTEQQRSFASDSAPVRVVHGFPGSGKTWSLWKALESRGSQKVLYLTWSRTLAESAQERFRCFAPKDTRVDALDFATFINRICGTDQPRITLEESRQKLQEFLDEGKVYDDTLSDWAKYRDAFYSSLRGDLFGAAIPGTADSIWQGNMARLSDAAYLGRTCEHSTKVSRDHLGRSLLKAAERLTELQAWEHIFPELAAAGKAILRLRATQSLDRMLDYQRIVVDEIQDLTLLEISVIAELYEAISRRGQQPPWLLIAGDDGQTVRPTSFDWGATNDLLSSRLANPKDYSLEENLRSPAKIYSVTDRMSKFYKSLSKDNRPSLKTDDRIYPDDSDDAGLLRHGIGFTDVVKRPTPQSSGLRAADFRQWAPLLRGKLLEHAPRLACFHGLMAYKAYLRYAEGERASPDLGLQPRGIGASRVFVAPNPSPANARYSLDDLAAWYDRLAAALQEGAEADSGPDSGPKSGSNFRAGLT